MLDVAILGAGELGGSIAYVLAHRDLVQSITLIDDKGQVAAGKALDITQVSPISGFATKVSAATDVSRAVGAAILVIADRAGGGEWTGDAGVQLLRQLSTSATRSIVICAGASQHSLVDRGVRELRYAHTRLFGSAPEALSAAVRALVALETNGSPRDVALTVLGLPPSQTVIPWEDATIAGIGATRVLDEPTRRRLAARVAPLWPPGPYALATAAVEAIAAATGRSRRTISAFVAPGQAEQPRVRTVALPVRLSGEGIEHVAHPPLSANASVALDNAMNL